MTAVGHGCVDGLGDVLLIDSQNSLCSLATLAGLTVYPPASQHGVFARSRLLSRCGDLDRSSSRAPTARLSYGGRRSAALCFRLRQGYGATGD